MATTRTLVAGNWKMNGLRADGAALAQAVVEGAVLCPPSVELLICPPAILLAEVAASIDDSSVALGAQDCSPEVRGAFTGDLSPKMLADVGCTFVILGHSERRQIHSETNELVAKKVAAAQGFRLSTIVCVGETATERDSNMALAVVEEQINQSLPQSCAAADLVVAYEPVWAIGTGRTPTIAEVEEVHGHLRARLVDRFADAGEKVRILYGGSVKPDNAAEILAAREVDGALVGGASLKADDFLAIANRCSA